MSSLNSVLWIYLFIYFKFKYPFLSARDIWRSRQRRISPRRAPWGTPRRWLQSLPLRLTVNRWLLLIDGCLPAQLNTNADAFGPPRVNSSDQHPPPHDSISPVITHQIITTAIPLPWIQSCGYSFFFLRMTDWWWLRWETVLLSLLCNYLKKGTT